MKVIRICFLALSMLIIGCHQKKETKNIEIADITADITYKTDNTPADNQIDVPVNLFVTKDIFVAGGYINTDDDVRERKEVICYWENGERTDMDIFSTADEAQIRAIAVSDGVVYAAGFYKVDDRARACYWVDGERINLDTPPGARSYAFDIAASGDTAYAAGYYYYYDNQGQKNVACYWQNGVRIDLLDIPAQVDPSTTSITVSDGAIYVAGYYRNDKYNFTYTPCYWVNGERIDIAVPNGASSATVYDIIVSDGIVYLACEYSTDSDRGGYYYVDGTIKKLDIPNSADSVDISGIAVIEGNVYVAGCHSYSDIGAMETYYTACYWINGERKDLGPANHSRTTGIAVSNGQFYISGYFEDRSTRIACCWINGIRMELPVPDGNIFSYTTAITVMKQ